MISTKLIIVAGVCVSLAVSQITAPVPVLSKGCTQNGHHYHTGQSFSPTPCEHCYCTDSGHVACAITDCFFTNCVDSIHDPTKCCPVCPNGPNCKHSDGTIIKKGEVYKPDADTTCMCPQNMFGLRGSMAICAIKAPAPVTVTAQTVS